MASLLHLDGSRGATAVSGAGTPASSQPNSLTADRHDSICTTVNGDVRSPTMSFPPSYPTACLVVWCQKEILTFISTFSRNVFLPSVPLCTLCESVSVLRNETNRVRNLIGLDFLFYVDKLIKEEIMKAIDDARKRLFDQLEAKVQGRGMASHRISNPFPPSQSTGRI